MNELLLCEPSHELIVMNELLLCEPSHELIAVSIMSMNATYDSCQTHGKKNITLLTWYVISHI